MTAVDSNVINRSEYYAIGKGLPDHGTPMAERPYTVGGDNYVIVGVLVVILMLAVVLHRSRLSFFYRMKEFFAVRRQFAEENIQSSTSDSTNVFLLTSVCALSLSLVLFNRLSQTMGFTPAYEMPYWLFAAGYVLFVALIYFKAWLYVLVNWVFFDRESNKKWISGYLLLTALLAYLIFPVSLIDIFVANSNLVVAISMFIVIIAYEMLLFFRLFAIFRTKKYGNVLLFLYFCSVEIIPAIVLGHTLYLLKGN